MTKNILGHEIYIDGSLISMIESPFWFRSTPWGWNAYNGHAYLDGGFQSLQDAVAFVLGQPAEKVRFA